MLRSPFDRRGRERWLFCLNVKASFEQRDQLRKVPLGGFFTVSGSVRHGVAVRRFRIDLALMLDSGGGERLVHQLLMFGVGIVVMVSVGQVDLGFYTADA